MFGLSTELIMKGTLASVKRFQYCHFEHLAFRFWIRSDKGLMLQTSALESLYGGQFTVSYQLC